MGRFKLVLNPGNMYLYNGLISCWSILWSVFPNINKQKFNVQWIVNNMQSYVRIFIKPMNRLQTAPVIRHVMNPMRGKNR